MAQDIRVKMKQFNGTDFDEIYPNSSNGIMAKIIITPNTPFTSVKATSPSGIVYNGVFQDSKWIIEVSEYGEYTIQNEGENPESKNLIIDICKIYEIELGFPKADPILNNNSWEIIRKYSDADKAKSTWAVGDAKQITINGTIGTKSFNNLAIYVYILGFNHNSDLEGNGITFGSFKTDLSGGVDVGLIDDYYGNSSTISKWFNMNHSPKSSVGGWKGCDLRCDILGSTDIKDEDAKSSTTSSPKALTLMAALPSDLRAVMKPMNIWTDNVGGDDPTSNITKSIDYLPLLATFEIFGSTDYANSAEQNYQKQYDYYKSGNSKKKYKYNETSSSISCWSRSPRSYMNGYFCITNGKGAADATYSEMSYGIAPIFRV